MPTHAPLVLLDIETTGLDPHKGAILQIAAFPVVATPRTDGILQFREEEGNRFQALIWTDDVKWDRWCVEHHARSGLAEAAAKEGVSRSAVDSDLTAWLTRLGYSPGKRAKLVGASIHFDKSWINAHLPIASGLLSYRIGDVSSVYHLFFESRSIEIPSKEAPHTAMEDCERTLAFLNTMTERLGIKF